LYSIHLWGNVSEGAPLKDLCQVLLSISESAVQRLLGHLPKSPMATAIDYTLANWKLLSVYLDDGRVEIDNNLVENAIRPTAIGK